jgi:hypothetical protein
VLRTERPVGRRWVPLLGAAGVLAGGELELRVVSA